MYNKQIRGKSHNQKERTEKVIARTYIKPKNKKWEE